MITIFTTPKAFSGESGRLQENAIRSWTLLVPRPQIFVFGDEVGTVQVCRDLDVEHVPEVAHNERGTPLVSDLFRAAEERGHDDIFCYVNADIILLDDFMAAVEAASSFARRFLLVGQRCSVSLPSDFDFIHRGWQADLRTIAGKSGLLDNDYYIDYFVFSRELFGRLPPFAIGRAAYDNWLVWKALHRRAPVIDASGAVLAIHQRHGYDHVVGGRDEVYAGYEARRNMELAGGPRNLRSIADATHTLTAHGSVISARGSKYAASRRERRRATVSSNRLVKATRPLRHAFGLRRDAWGSARRLFSRIRR